MISFITWLVFPCLSKTNVCHFPASIFCRFHSKLSSNLVCETLFQKDEKQKMVFLRAIFHN
jgi:hypothetical protein